MNELIMNDVLALTVLEDFIKEMIDAGIKDLVACSLGEREYILEALIEIRENGKIIKSKLSKEKQDRVENIVFLGMQAIIVREKIKQMNK